MEKCFADKGKTCVALNEKNCNGCGFYKTKSDLVDAQRYSCAKLLSTGLLCHYRQKYPKFLANTSAGA